MKKIMNRLVALATFAFAACFSLNAQIQVTTPVNVAKVGDTKYTNLATALNAAKTAGSTCELLCDVNLTGIEWMPVADFAGTFDGKGYKIMGLTLEGTKNVGLFASLSGATIKDVIIDEATITGTGDGQQNVGVLAGSLGVSKVSGVQILNSTISSTAKYTGGLTGNSSSTISSCVISNCVVTGKDQVGGIVGYQWCNGVWDCKVAECKVTATEERAGAVIGKLQCASGNDSHFDANNNVISACTVTAPDYAGGFVGQIHGDAGTYSIKNNVIDAVLTANETNPIGVLRPFSEGAITTDFTAALAQNITGNDWTDATLAANSFQYTNVGTGVDPQTINRTTIVTYVAKVGTVQCANLAAALDAAKTAGSTCELLSDVNLTGVAWTPVADFKGTFDGKGYKITGLTLEGTKNVGLFASLDGATIKDVIIDGATITGTGNGQQNVGVLAGSIGVSKVSGVQILNSTVSSTAKYTGGLTGNSSSTISSCVISNCVVTGKDQVGGIVGYQWCNGVWDCKVAECKVTATEERAGAVIGKLQCSSGNDSHFDANNNVISACTVTAPDYAGGFVGQIHGDAGTYSIKNNVIDAVLTANETNPIGVLRPFSEGAITTDFTAALAQNITGNDWTDATLAANSFQYTNVGTGVDPQTIWRATVVDQVYVIPETIKAIEVADSPTEEGTKVVNVESTNVVEKVEAQIDQATAQIVVQKIEQLNTTAEAVAKTTGIQELSEDVEEAVEQEIIKGDTTKKAETILKVEVSLSTIKIAEVTAQDVSLTNVTKAAFEVTPTAVVTVTKTDSSEEAEVETYMVAIPAGTPITFRLPVDAATTAVKAEVFHEGTSIGYYDVKSEGEGENLKKYVEITSSDFSEYGYELLTSVTADTVAMIGDKGYDTIAAAIEAANAVTDGSEQTITLIKDCSVSADYQSTSMLVLSAANVTLDLNEKTLTTFGNFAFTIGGDNDKVINGTIQAGPNADKTTGINSYAIVVASMDADTKVTGVVFDGLTVNGGIAVGAASGVTCKGGCELVIRNCTCTAGDYYTVYAQGTGTATIESGMHTLSVPANNSVVGAAGNGKIIVKGGTFNDNSWTTQYDTDHVCIADGYELTKVGDKYVVTTAYVAQIGETKYTTLTNAIDMAADGATITIIADIAECPCVSFSKSLTIDLDGHTIAAKNATNDGLSRLFTVTGTADVTVKNGAIDTPDALYGSMRFESTGKLTMTDLTLTNSRANGMNIKMCNGTGVFERLNITATTGGGIEVAGPAVIRDSVIAQSGTDGTCASSAMGVNSGATLTVEGGTYSGYYGAYVFTSGGTIILNNVALTGECAACKCDNYTLEENQVASVIIVNSGAVDGMMDLSNNWKNPASEGQVSVSQINLNGGTYSNFDWSKEQLQYAGWRENVKLVITGGTYDKNPTTDSQYGSTGYVASGYEAVSDGKLPPTWTVGEKMVAQVGENKYATLAAAVEAAKAASAETVTLLADCTVDTEVVVGSSAAKIIRTIEGTNSVAGGYYTITVKDGGNFKWDYDGWKTNATLNANVVDQTTAGNGLYLRGWSAKVPMVIAGSVTLGDADTLSGLWFMGTITASAPKITGTSNVYGSIDADSISGGNFYCDVDVPTISSGFYNCNVTATTISGGTYYEDFAVVATSITGGTFKGDVTAESISGGSYYNVDDLAALKDMLASGKTLIRYAQSGSSYYVVKDISAVGATALRSGSTINYENAGYALQYSAANDVVTMVTKYWADLTLPYAVTLVISNVTGYVKTVNACDSQHVIKATAIEGGTQYVNAVDPEASVAYLVHGTTTNYCVTVAGAINDAVSGDEICLTKDCAEDLTLKVGVTVNRNGHSFTGTYTAQTYCIVTVDETAGTYTERYRELTDDDAVASLDATERTLYYAKVGDAAEDSETQGTTVTLLKNVTLTDDDIGDKGDYICDYIGDGKIFDGAGYTVTYAGTQACHFTYQLAGTIKNTTFVNFKQAIADSVVGKNAKFDTVKVTGAMQFNGHNGGAFVDNMIFDNNVCTFQDCEMAMTCSEDGGWTNYNAAFVGWLSKPQTLNFVRCRVTGSVVCGTAAMFIANCQDYAIVLNVTDCYNEGLIHASYLTDPEGTRGSAYVWNPIVGHTGAAGTITLNLTVGDSAKTYVGVSGDNNFAQEEVFTALTRYDGRFVNGPSDETLTFMLNDQDGFVINTATTNTVDHYILSLGTYCDMAGGSSYVDASETISCTATNVVILPNIKNYLFVDKTWLDTHEGAVEGEAFGLPTYTYDNVTYYYIAPGSSSRTLQGMVTPASNYSLTAYDANGTLLSSVALSSGCYTLVAGVSSAAESVTYLYDTLESAIQNVEQDGVVTVLADNDESFTAAPKSGVTAFTIDNTADYDVTGTITSPEGYELNDNGDGTWSFQQAAYVAQIGETKFTSLAAAIAAVPTDGTETTIQMIADESFTGTNPLTIAAGKKIVLDLNGCTLSYVASNTDADAFITNKGDLTVTDTSEDKNGKITAKQNTDPNWTYGCYTIDNAGTYDTTGHLVINAGTIENTSNSGLAWPINNGWWGTKADCVISGGTIHSANYVPVRQYYQYGGCKTMTISGGTFIADNSRAVAVQFNDATVQETGSYVKITGGTFTCNGSGTLYMDLHVANVDTTGANITVSGGTFTNIQTANPLIAYDNEGKDQTSAVLLSKIISGGTYSADPTTWVADGYEAAKSGDNWVVGAKPVAQIGSTTYTNLHDAFAACKSGETVELLCNVDLKNEAWTPIELNGSFNGCNYTISNLYINLPEQTQVGFFTRMQYDSVIRNVNFVNIDVKGKTDVGGLVGYHAEGDFENITVTGSIKVEGVGGTADEYACVGGIVGGFGYGKYQNITIDGGDQSTSYVKYEYSAGDGRYVGGIVGHADDAELYENCTVKNITIKGKWLSGGIAGPGPGKAVCTGCTVENVTIGGSYSGAMFGWLFDRSEEIDNQGIVSNATIRNVTYLTTTQCGTVGGYGVDTNVVVRNITIESVPVLPYHYQVYTVEDSVTNHYGTILAAITSVANIEDITVSNDKVAVPSGYELYAKDILWGVRENAKVVRVGTKEYSSIDAALAASSGDVEMVLIGNASCDRIELSGNVCSQIDNLTIDLNGYTLTNGGGDAFLTVNRLITVKDSVGTGLFTHTGTDDLVWLQGTTGGVLLESGNFNLVDGGYGLAYASHDATRNMLVIKGGTYNLCPTNDSKGVNYVPAGYEAVAQGTTPETWTVQEAVTYVAQVTSADGKTVTKYATLKDACAAFAYGETLTLLADITVTDNAVVYGTENPIYGMTIDGGNHTITIAKDGVTAIKLGAVATYDRECYGMTISNLTVVTADGITAKHGIYQYGGQVTDMKNVNVSGAYTGYAYCFNSCGGATMDNCHLSNTHDSGTDNEFGCAVWSSVAYEFPITLTNGTTISGIGINKYNSHNPLYPRIFSDKTSTIGKIVTYEDKAVAKTYLMSTDGDAISQVEHFYYIDGNNEPVEITTFAATIPVEYDAQWVIPSEVVHMTAKVAYDTLEGAIQSVEQNGTITLTADNSESFTAAPKSGVTAFTIDNTAEYDISGTITTPEGYELNDNGDGTWSFQQAAYVAQNLTTATQYSDLAAAIAAATSGDTIQMIADVDVVFDTAAYITIGSGKSVTLDLNGKVITSATTYSSSSQLIYLNGGNLTITDTAAKDAEGKFTGKIIHGANPTWIYEGGDDYSGSYASVIIMERYSASLTINGGHIENISTGSAAYAIDLSANTTSADKTTKLVINDGEIIATRTAIRIYDGSGSDGGSDVAVNGGYIYGAGYSGMMIQSPSGESAGPAKCDFTVTDGIIKGGSYAFYDYTFGQLLTNHNYTISGGLFDGYIWSYGANLNISDGEFTEDVEIYKNGYGVNTIEVLGGYFDDYFTVYPENGASDSDIMVVSGGFYANAQLANGWNLSDYVVDGYEVVDNTDVATSDAYPYTIAEAAVPVCQNLTTGTQYSDLAAAIAATTSGDTIQMIANVDYGEFSGVALDIAGDRNFTLDLAGYTISGTATNKSASELILMNPGANVSITNSTETEGVITYSTTQPDPGWWYGTSTILNKGTLTLNAGRIVNTSNGGASYVVDNNTHISACTFIMNGGKTQCDSGDQCVRLCAISGTSVSQRYENRFEMHGGEIVSGGLWVNMNATSNDNFPAEKDWATVVVDGGTINGGIDLVCRGTTSITLGDATYNVTRLRLRKPTNLAEENEGILFAGGKWSIAEVQYYEDWTKAAAEESGLIAVTGGVYTATAKDILAGFVADGYEVIDNTDDETKTAYPWTVAEISGPAASIGTVEYDTLAEAITNVTEGQTIVILRNNSESFEVDKSCAFFIDNSDNYKLTGSVTVNSTGYDFIRTDTGCKFAKVNTISFAAFDNEPAKPTELPSAMTVYAEQSWDLPVLGTESYDSADYTFVGWTDKDDSGDVIKEFAAGLATNSVTLYAKFSRLAKPSDSGTIEVKPTEGAETKQAINVTEDWVKKNVAAEDPVKGATASEINTVLEQTDANGLKKWQNYVLGLENDTNELGEVTAQVVSDAAQVDDVNTIPVIPAFSPKADTGFTVKYELDDVTDAGNVQNVISATNIEALVIDVNSVEKSAKFKVNVILTPDGATTGEKIAATNTIGVLKTDTTAKHTLIAVPWAGLDGKRVTVANLLKTANLTTNDTINVYDSKINDYYGWKLDANKIWQPVSKRYGGSKKTTNGGAANEYSLKRGVAIWINRADISTPLVFFGEDVDEQSDSDETKGESEIVAGSTTNPSWNLVASPSVEDLDLNDGKLKGEKDGAITPAAGDQIQIPTDTTPVTYTFKSGEWKYSKKVQTTYGLKIQWFKATDKIPAGQGFWYINKGTDKKIEW